MKREREREREGERETTVVGPRDYMEYFLTRNIFD